MKTTKIIALVCLFMLVLLPFVGNIKASPACPQGSALNIVAHQDDDIIFINPAIQQAITAGKCVSTTFLTAGQAAEASPAYWQGREEGAKAAYAQMAGVTNTWTQQVIEMAGHNLQLATLADKPAIKLIFMRLSDGNMGGEGFAGAQFESLQKLWFGSIPTMRAIDGTTSYTKQELVNTLLAIMSAYQPDVINTEDYLTALGGGDHSDHYITAYFAQAAHRLYTTPHSINSYQGYPDASLPVNLSSANYQSKLATFLTYAPYDSHVCQTTNQCEAQSYGGWLKRQYQLTAESGGFGNIGALATVTTSSQNTTYNQQASKTVDGVFSGSPYDYTKEWATVGGKAGSWVKLTWASQHTVNRIVLYDRLNSDDQVTAGRLLFSDGSSVSTGALPNTGLGKVVTFPSKPITSVQFVVDGVSGSTFNIGLAEIQVFEPNVAPLAAITASSQNSADGQLALKAVDGFAVGHPVDYTKEWATVGGKAGSWIKLTWATPQSVNRVVLFDRPNSDDQIISGTLTFNDGSSVPVGQLANSGSPLVISFPEKTITSLQLTITGVSTTTYNTGLSELQVLKF